jgi:hypothetical protein
MDLITRRSSEVFGKVLFIEVDKGTFLFLRLGVDGT